MNITAFDLAQRYVGVKEIPGTMSNPVILAMLQLDSDWPTNDEVAWCSAFCNWINWHLRLPRSKSLMARSWLDVARPILGKDAKVGYDVVVLSRSGDPNAGHVGFYAGLSDYPPKRTSSVYLLGGNQSDSVSVAPFPVSRILGIRRTYEGP